MVEFATGDLEESAEDALAGAISEHEGTTLYSIHTRGRTGPEARGGRYND